MSSANDRNTHAVPRLSAGRNEEHVTPVWPARRWPAGQPALTAPPAAMLDQPAGLASLDAGVPRDALDLVVQAAGHLPAPCYLYDAQTQRLTWANRQFVATFMAGEGQPAALPRFTDLAHPDDLGLLASRAGSLAAAHEGEIVASACRLRAAAGWQDCRLQEAILARSLDGRPRLVLGLVQAAGAARPAGKARRGEELGLERIIQVALANAHLYAAEYEQRRLFETALAHVPLATAILDGQTLTIRWANRAFGDFVDEPYRQAALDGLALEQVMAHLGASGLAEIIRRVTASGRPCSDLRYVYNGPQCGPRYWRFSLQPVPSDGGHGELMLHVEDVSDRVRGPKGAAGPGAGTPVRVIS